MKLKKIERWIHYIDIFFKVYGSDYKNDKSLGVLSEVFPLIFFFVVSSWSTFCNEKEYSYGLYGFAISKIAI
jgi:hypothetical protein